MAVVSLADKRLALRRQFDDARMSIRRIERPNHKSTLLNPIHSGCDRSAGETNFAMELR